MSLEIDDKLKMILKPVIVYYGEWNLDVNLEKNSLVINSNDKYQNFLNRYYYAPLNVIFKNDELVKSFNCSICSRLGQKGRSLFFSKKEFLRTIIPNIDDVINSNGDDAYKDIKKAIRLKKDMYRAVDKIGEDSEYYEDVKNEYNVCGDGYSFDDFVKMCKTKYTRLLNGYNTFLQIFDKPLDIDKFIDCFSKDQLYLLVIYSLLKYNESLFLKYNKVDYNYKDIVDYVHWVSNKRLEDNFYNSFIRIERLNENAVYTIDDLIKEFDCFDKSIGE